MIDFPLIYGMYRIDIGESVAPTDGFSQVYRITNQETGVVEAETSSLPQAILSASTADATLIRLMSTELPTPGELDELEWGDDSTGNIKPSGTKH